MASVKIEYMAHYCPRCKGMMFSTPVDGGVIGSPIVECPHCGYVSKTMYRSEWYNYYGKKSVFLRPLKNLGIGFLIGAVAGFAVSASGKNRAEMMLPAMLIGGIIMGLMFSIASLIGLVVNIFQICASVKRMKDPKYLLKLKEFSLIDSAEYEDLLRKAIAK